MLGHFPFSVFSFRFFVLVLLALGLQGGASAANLVVKDDYRSPRNKERPLRKATTLIVLHTTEAHATSSLNKLSERGEAHYCVTEKGIVYRIIDRDREAFHAGRSMWNGKEDCDEYAIGIEVVGHHDQSMPLVQLEALKELVDRLKKSYKLKDHQVVCHSHVAYGAPNTWHKKKHRGRKRCGMLFAMASVRRKLGLTARPAYDPDVRAKRLVQADEYLDTVLYGNVDTMARFYGGKGAAVVAVAPAPAQTTPKSAKTSAPAKSAPASKPSVAGNKTSSKAPAKTPAVPPPVVKPALIVPPSPVKTVPKVSSEAESAEQTDDGWLKVLGLKGGYFKKKAKLIRPAESEPRETANPEPASQSNVLPLPPNLVIGKMGDDVRDLEALARLPGYARGGPVTLERSPYKIAGSAWNAPSTYYWTPSRKILRGDKVDPRSIEPGTWIFFKK